MSNEQRYHLNRLAQLLVTPQRFCQNPRRLDFKVSVIIKPVEFRIVNEDNRRVGI